MKDRQKRVITALYAAMKEADGLHDGGSVAMSIFELLLGIEAGFQEENEAASINGMETER